ncbi:MAG: PHP domain-containing protein [Candidatus Sumerlaeota bacterium]|nr:PHP domain-containing protein [Candidatus Sumerlaeota bacterium]
MQLVPFVHLHVHSKYSLDDGMASVEALVDAAARQGMNALALTDHNSIAGFLDFKRACQERGIHPVFGAEIDLLPAGAPRYAGKSFRAVALAENDSGLGNLAAIVSEAWRHQSNDAPPHVSLEVLAQKRAGLILLMGGRRSEIHWLLKREDVDELSRHLQQLLALFDHERLAFEIWNHGDPDTGLINGYLDEMARIVGVPLVMTNDAHYLLPEDEFAWRFLRNVPLQGPIYPRKFLREELTRHLASPQEMQARAPGLEHALRGATEIAGRCRASLGRERRHFPVHDFERGRDALSDLWDRVFQSAAQIYGGLTEKIKDRLNRELEYIQRRRFADYFQLLYHISQHLAENNITRGTGQGQLLTSLVAHVLGLTEIDPMEYNLGFFGDHHPDNETEGEKAPPVFSIALPARSLPHIFSYLRGAYGENRVTGLGRYPESHKGKLFLQLCEWARMDRPRAYELMDNGILDGRGRQPERLTDLLDQSSPSLRADNPQFLAFLISRLHPRLKPIKPLEGYILISGEDLDRVTPRLRIADQEVAQIESDDLLAMGLPQIHLETNELLDILDEALRWARLEYGKDINLSAIPLDDKETFDVLCGGRTNGIPPFQSPVMKALLRKHKPRTLQKLIKVKLDLTPDDEPPGGDDFTNVFMQCLLGYRCAYLKARFPVSFLTAMLNHTVRDAKAFSVIWRETERMDIRHHPLNINHSPYDFTQANNTIHVGMRVVRLLAEKTFQEIEAVRRGGEFSDLADFCRRTEPQLIRRPLIENLIRAGAFDCFGQSRAHAIQSLSSILAASRPRPVNEQEAEMPLFAATGVRLDAPAPEAQPHKAPVEEEPLYKLLHYERLAAGFVLSRPSLAPYYEYLERCRAMKTGDITHKHDGRRVFLAGQIDGTEHKSPTLEAAPDLLIDFENLTVMARPSETQKFSAAIFSDQPVLVGGTVRLSGGEPVLHLNYCATLRELSDAALSIKGILLNLIYSDKASLRYIHAALKQYPGATPIQTQRNPAITGFSARWYKHIESATVFWCPPLEYELRQILHDTNCIIVQATKPA